MRNTTLKNAFAMSFAAALGVAVMTAPTSAYAATRVPGSCELVKNTVCNAPGTLLQQILNLFSLH